jgi:Mn2+/Fe2+ NRAMP family transporter
MSRQTTIAEARWADRFDWVRWLGPGFVMAATAIGASHLILAPTAGALYGYGLLWLVTFAHLFKYPAFDFGPRYAVATNSTLLDGYARVPGPRNWALWTFLLGTVVQGVTVLAGVLSVAAVVARAVVPDLSLVAWSGAIAGLGAVVLWSGRFSGLSAASKAMLTVLAIMTVIAFFARPPPPAIVIELVRPHLPVGSLVLAAAMLGWMPTGLDVSVWHSMWALERRDTWAERAGPGPDQKRGVLAIALTDMRLGYGLSFVLAVMFLALGVAVLKPTGSVPQGGQVAITIARLYTDVLGSWAFYPFLIAAFFGMTSTSFGVLDGFPRVYRMRASDRAGAARRATALLGLSGLYRVARAARDSAVSRPRRLGDGRRRGELSPVTANVRAQLLLRDTPHRATRPAARQLSPSMGGVWHRVRHSSSGSFSGSPILKSIVQAIAFSIVLAISVGCSGSPAPPSLSADQPPDNASATPTKLILFIADGAGMGHWSALWSASAWGPTRCRGLR